MRNLLELDEFAHQLYKKEADAEAFVNNFTLEELVTLWYLKCLYTETNDGAMVATTENGLFVLMPLKPKKGA